MALIVLRSTQKDQLDGNPYRDWIETYAGDEYREVAAASCEQLDRVAAERIGDDVTASGRWPSLQQTFTAATRLEIGFRDMGMAG